MKPDFGDVVDYFEDEYDITGLLMRDFGSRAWGLAGVDSDYDALLVYWQEPTRYQKIGDDSSVEHFQRSYEDSQFDIDVQGWSLQKFVSLCADSNPTALEFCNSPVTYYQHSLQIEQLFNTFAEYCTSHANPIALYWHYRSLGEDQYTKYVEENVHYDGSNVDERYQILEETDDEWVLNVQSSDLHTDDTTTVRKAKSRYTETTTDQTVKRNMYAARGIAYAKYVRHSKEMPPMNFAEFLSASQQQTGLSGEQYELLEKLATLKRTNSNRHIGNVIEELVTNELALTPNNDALIRDDGITNERCNEFIDDCTVVCRR